MDAPDIDRAKKEIEQAFAADVFHHPFGAIAHAFKGLAAAGYFDLTVLYRQFYDPMAALLKPSLLVYYVVIGTGIFLVKRSSWGSHPSLREYVFPKNVLTARSFRLDVQWFLLNLLKITSVITTVFSLLVFTRLLTRYLDGGPFAWEWARVHVGGLPVVWRNVLFFLSVVVSLDFLLYWEHRLMHTIPVLWHFHKVHHYPRQITFLANWRVHPVEALLGDITDKLALALVMALWTPLYSAQDVRGYEEFFKSQAPVLAAVLAVQYFFHSFNHTTIYVRFGGWLDKVFYSPALHLIHHSRDIRDKNFGNIFGLWDWMFGTIYVPRDIAEHYAISQRLGVSNMADEEYKTVVHAMVLPFLDCLPKNRRRRVPRKVAGEVPESVA